MNTLSGHDPEGEAYLAAIYGGREITAGLAAKAAAIREQLEVDAGFDYNLRTGQLRVVRDDKGIEDYDIPFPDGYYGGREGFRIRNRYAIVGLVLTTAEAMFDWPIYRAATGLGVDDRRRVRDALEYAAEDLQYRVDNDHFPNDDDDDGAAEEQRTQTVEAWKRLQEVLA